MVRIYPKYENEDDLLRKFNNGDKSAFSNVYMQLFDELNGFAKRLFYATEIDSKDLIQDIFMNVWSNKHLKFISLDHIKNYIYLAIKNKHTNFVKHKLCHEEYEKQVKEMNDYQLNAVIETETISLLSLVDDLLPAQCSEVIKLFLSGYDAKEIAEKLGKSQYTIYHQRTEGIRILKRYTTSKKITLLLNFLMIL